MCTRIISDLDTAIEIVAESDKNTKVAPLPEAPLPEEYFRKCMRSLKYRDRNFRSVRFAGFRIEEQYC